LGKSGLNASIVVPNLGFLAGEADKVKDKPNAQAIMLAYTTGVTAGVVSPEGDVAIQVVAVLERRKPASGSLASMMFHSTLAPGTVLGTYP
jgi:hypothetical protein